MSQLEPFLRCYEVLTHRCFITESRYAAAGAAARRELENGRLEARKLELSAGAIDAWVEALGTGTGGERPPLDYYCRLLTVFGLGLPLAFDSAWALMKAANYYGDSQLVLDLATRLRPDPADDRVFSVLKETAKAHKNSGGFTEAQQCYRDALSFCEKGRDDTVIAYFLMLFAKLCNDYQQKLGWHLALHEIALRRLERAAEDGAVAAGRLAAEKRARWLQICRDSYAKAVYRERPNEAEDLFHQVLSLPWLGEELRLRIEARHIEARMLHLYTGSERQSRDLMQEADGYLRRFREIRDRLIECGNIRASTVRRVQFLKLTREALAWSEALGGEIPTAVELGSGGAAMEASSAREAALDLSDTKTAALASIEIAMWNDFDSKRRRSGRTGDVVPATVIEQLEAARSILEDGSLRDYEVYPAILESLGSAHARMRNWSAATEAYELALARCEAAIESVEEDDRSLRAVLAREGPREHELEHFADAELQLVLDRLRLDYRVLLIRMRDLGRSLRSTHVVHMAEAVRRQISLSNFRYHEIKGCLDDLEQIDDRNEMTTRLTELKDQLIRWVNEENDNWRVMRFDLGAAVQRILDNPRTFVDFQGIIRLASFQDRRMEADFDEYFLGLILKNLLENIRDVAKRRNLKEYGACIDLHRDDEIVYLRMDDDVGERERLEEVVGKLNARLPVPSFKEGGGGEGLKLVKKSIEALTGLNQDWQVKGIDERWKSLRLPLARLSGPGRSPGLR